MEQTYGWAKLTFPPINLWSLPRMSVDIRSYPRASETNRKRKTLSEESRRAKELLRIINQTRGIII